MRTVSIGKQNFAFLREKNCFYVDKTKFIKEWWESEDDTTLITRPRRFGKTLNMSMLECFFSVKYAERSDLFEGLAIWEEKTYRELQGTCPVLFFTFADVKSAKYENAIAGIKSNLVDLYNANDFLMKGDLLNEVEKKQYKSVLPDMSDAVAVKAIRNLMDYLSRYHGKNVIVLLDEYDTPLQEAYVYGYWQEMVEFIRELFNATFKTNPYLERAVMTGITRVSKESIFSDLNHLKVVTTTSDKYETAFGFTEEEVFASLDEAGMSGEKEKVKAWYDGFTFGRHTDIYNPWSITNFLDSGIYGAYWADTSSNGMVGKLIQRGSVEVKNITEDLLEGKTLVTQIDEQIIFNQLDGDENAIWGLLLASGYLKVISHTFDEESGMFTHELALTNKEVLIMFRKMIQGWFRKSSASYNDFVKALLQGDIKAMNYYMNKVALATISFFDSGNRPSDNAEPERFYHGFVLGLMVDQRKDYVVTSNRESGFGRYDVVMEPRNPEDNSLPAIVLEFKVHDADEESTLEDTVKAAHTQIAEKGYDAGLLERGIPRDRIRHYGFAFEGKQVLIG